MEGMMQNQLQQPQQQPQPQQPQPAVEKLNQAVQQQLNLEQVKTRAISLFKAISRILEDFDAYARTNTNPKCKRARLRLSGDQRHITPSLPMHLADVLTVYEAPQPFADTSGAQLMGRSAASPSAAISTTSFDNATASPMPYANSPSSSTNMMNTPSPQHQTPQQQQQPLTQQQQRQKLMQLPQHQQQQLLAQQQLRQSAMQGMGQMHGHNQMQFSQSLGHQPFQGRQLSSAHVQHGIGQSQLNQGNQMNRLSQFSGSANSALFNAAQATPNTQMV